MSNSSIKALLFDLGGVVVDVDFTRVFRAWASLSEISESDIKSQFKMDEPYRQHERGQIQAVAFWQHLRECFQLTASDAEMSTAWNSIFGGEITRSLDAIDGVRHSIPTFGFSNTNRTHQIYWEHHYPRLQNTFEKLYVSSELGLRKPDAEAFNFVLNDIEVNADELLFFDDSPENIEGAEKVGIQTILVSGPDSVIQALSRF